MFNQFRHNEHVAAEPGTVGRVVVQAVDGQYVLAGLEQSAGRRNAEILEGQRLGIDVIRRRARIPGRRRTPAIPPPGRRRVA